MCESFESDMASHMAFYFWEFCCIPAGNEKEVFSEKRLVRMLTQCYLGDF